MGGTAYFALKPGLSPSGSRVVLKIEPLESAMEGGRLDGAPVAEVEPSPQADEAKSDAPVETASETAPPQPADPFKSAFDAPGPGKAIGADIRPADEAQDAVATAEPGEFPVAAATDFRKSAVESESVSSVAPAEPITPRFAPAETDRPEVRPGLELRAAPETRAVFEPGPALESRAAPEMRPAIETHGVEERSASLQQEPSPVVEERAEALPFKDGADVEQSASSGEGVSLDGAVFAEAPQEILEQAMIEAADPISEPTIANTAGQGVSHRGRPAKKDARPEPKGPPAMLHFSAGTVASAAKTAPAPDLFPIGGDEAPNQ